MIAVYVPHRTPCFVEPAEMVARGLRILGYAAVVSQMQPVGADHVIAFGGNVAEPPAGAVLVQMEHACSPWMSDATYQSRLSAAPAAWDFSAWNAAHTRVADAFSCFADPASPDVPVHQAVPYDVVFAGASSPRRERILAALEAAGLNVFVARGANAAYGETLRSAYTRAWVALSVNYYDEPCAVDAARISLVPACTSIVAEQGSSGEEVLYPDVTFASYAKIVDAVHERVIQATETSHERCVGAAFRGLVFLRSLERLAAKAFGPPH